MIEPAAWLALDELLDDALRCPRLSDWEESFLANLRARLAQFGRQLTLTDKQQAVLKRIEAKVYAVG